MPATQCDGKAPIFQVYGTKRKTSEFQSKSMFEQDENLQVAGYPKRRCLFTEELHFEQTHQTQGRMAADRSQLADVTECTRGFPPAVNKQQTNETQDHTVPNSQRVAMDVKDGTFSHFAVPVLLVADNTTQPLQVETGPTAAETDLAAMAMDTDFVPDPYQYTSLPTNQGSFCQSYCGYGDSSPTSGRIKCFCKPSWEGMLDIRPYISDIY